MSQALQNSDLAIIFSLLNLGFFGGFSHCTAMCGPLVLSQVSYRLENTELKEFYGLKKLARLSLVSYHLGRITTYSLIGWTCFLLRKNLDDFLGFRLLAISFLLISCLIFTKNFWTQNKIWLKKYLGNALKKLILIPSFLISFCKKNRKKFPSKNPVNKIFGLKIRSKIRQKIFFGIFFGSKTKFRIFYDRFFAYFSYSIIKKLSKNDSWINGYFLGIILGFIPCGMLYGAFLLACSASNAFFAISGMVLFGLATFPALFCVSLFGRSLNLLPEFRFIAAFVQILTIFFLLKLSFTLILKG